MLDPINFPYCMTSFVRQVDDISEILMVRKWQKSARSGRREPIKIHSTSLRVLMDIINF